MFVSPFYLLFATFALFPPIYGIYISFFKWNGLTAPVFVGLANYRGLIHSGLFWLSLANTLEIAALGAIPGLGAAFLVAFVLDRYVGRVRRLYLGVLFAPLVASTPAVALLFTLMFDPSHGVVNNGLRELGIPPVNWLGDPLALKFTVVILLVWESLGYNTVIYFAGLQAVPGDLYEACMVDGANPWHVIWYVVIPYLRPVVLLTTVLWTIGTLQLFAEPFLLAGASGGPNQTVLTMLMNVYNNSFTDLRFGYGSALGVMLLIMALLGTGLNLAIGQRKSAV